MTDRLLNDERRMPPQPTGPNAYTILRDAYFNLRFAHVSERLGRRAAAHAAGTQVRGSRFALSVLQPTAGGMFANIRLEEYVGSEDTRTTTVKMLSGKFALIEEVQIDQVTWWTYGEPYHPSSFNSQDQDASSMHIRDAIYNMKLADHMLRRA